MSNYIRVLPRDLFNEAKLLKCLGQLCLKILDGHLPAQWGLCHNEYLSEYGDDFNERQGFHVVQNPATGSLHIDNLKFFYAGPAGATELELYTPLNSKRNYPLMAVFPEDDYFVFRDDGNFTPEFIIAMNDATATEDTSDE